MQFFKRFNKSTAGGLVNYLKTKGVAGVTGGVEEMTTEILQQLYSNKTAKDIYNINQSILDGVGSSGGIGFGVGFLLNAMGANAKILRKQGKVKEADALENQVNQYEDNLKNPKVTSGNKESVVKIVTKGEAGADEAVVSLDKDLANNVITPKQHQEGLSFVEKAFQVWDKIPETVTGESRAKSIELLVERNDIKQANDNLLQQKQTADEAYHAGIDEEIKANEERIKKIDSEVYNITKKPSKEFGTKRYEIDGEEVTKEAFEALTGKPIGTKEIIAAEVKPVETYEDKVKQILINQSKAEGYRYMGAASDLAKIPIEDIQSNINDAIKEYKWKDITTDDLPIKTVYRLKAEFEAKGYGDIPDGTKIESIKDKIDSLEPSEGRLLEDDIYKRRKEELDSLSYLPMTIKDDMTPADKKKVQDRRDEIKKINDKYDAELASLKVKPVVKVKEEVKPIEDINKANVTIEGTIDGYKVISGDKTNSIGDIRQEANEARAKGQDTFTKETVKDGKKIFTLTDTTVSDEFGRPGFKSASISFPEGTKVTMEDVMAKLKSELGTKVKSTEVSLASPEKMNASQNRYGIVKDGTEVGSIVTGNSKDGFVKIKGVTVNEDLRGKGIAGDAYIKLGNSLAKEGVTLESDSFDKMEPSATRVWEKLADKGLAVKYENSYQFKPTEETQEVKPTEDIYFNQLHRTEKFDDNASVSTYLGHNKNEKNIFYTLPNKGIISYDEVIPNTNRFTITANAKNDTPTDIKNAFKRIEKYLPANHELLENKSISVDGLKVWDKFIKNKKYIKTGEINEVQITPIDKENIFKDLKYTTENKWSGAKFENKGEVEAIARVEKYLKDNNLDFKVKLDGDVIKVEVPVLKYNPTEEVKPTEVKEEVKVKAPTKELAEGEEVTFNTPEGKKLTGEKITIPGFERIDMVLVKDGLNYTVYDLASGSGLGEGDFSKENAIESLINQFKEKNITQPKIYGLIYKSTNTSSLENSKNRVPQINPSSMFEYYSGKRKALEKEEYEKLPLKFNSEEIKKLKELKKRAEDFGIDKMAKEIEGAIISRAKEGTFKPKTDYYEGLLKKDIDEKIKKEAEDKGVPYPKEYMKERPRITMDKLKAIVNEGFKRDKFESIPEDVRKIMLDGYQKNIDILNKYGYYPDEKTKVFNDKLYQYVAAQAKRENRESQITEAKKELISALDYLNKAHEKEFGKKAETETKPKEGEVKVAIDEEFVDNKIKVIKEQGKPLSEFRVGDKVIWASDWDKRWKQLSEGKIVKTGNEYEIERFSDNPMFKRFKTFRLSSNTNVMLKPKGESNYIGEETILKEITKDDLKKAEAKFAVAEDKFKKARAKIESTQVKQTGMFGGEQKGMFAMGGEEAKSTLDPLRKAAKEAKAELDDIKNRIKVQEEAQPELEPIGTSESIKEMAQALRDFDKIIKGNKTAGTEVYQKAVALINEKKTHKFTGKGWEDVSEAYYKALKSGNNPELIKLIDNALAKETPYQKALKEKQEADKKQNRQIGVEKAAITKEIFRKVKQMDAPADAEQIALRYLADGGTVSSAAVDEAYGRVKRAELNTGRKEFKSSEVKLKDFVSGDETLNDLAHRLWEVNKQRVSERDIKNALMAEIGNNNTRLEAAEAYLDNYNEEYKQEKEEMRLAEQYKEEYLEEQEKLEKELREPLTEQIEGEASEEHINNLIDQYEAEIKGEDQQFGPESEGKVNKEAGKGKVSEKAQQTELAKGFKEATAKAGKKAKENAKKDFVERNFEDIVQKLKIQIKCPT
jgi:hypothetical protein